MTHTKFKRILIIMILCITFLASTIVSVGATTNSDVLYANAFNAVNTCQNSNTQQSINHARGTIEALNGTSASWAIGEFSKQTDVVQQKLFEEFMGLLFTKNNEPKPRVPQTDINRSKDLVISFDTYEGNKPYTASWSSAVDKYQQMILEEIAKLVSTAESTKKSADIESAKNGINILLTAKNNQGVINFANSLMTRVKAIVGTEEELLKEEAVKLVTNAESTKKAVDIENAKKAVNKLLAASNNQDTINFANGLMARVNAIVDIDQELLKEKAAKLVTTAETTKKTADIESAKKAINKVLEVSNDKDTINFANKLLARVNSIIPNDDKKINVLGGRAGHNLNCVGSSSILDEATETRKIFEKCFNYLKPVTDIVDCTPYHNPSNQQDDLKYGVNKANSSNVDLFFSIHLNKAYNTIQERGIGSEVWVYDENSTEAIKRGKAILSNLEKLGFKNRGIKYSKNLFELDNTNGEAMIIECFFLESMFDTNLYNEVGFDKLGQAIANGLDSRVPFSVDPKTSIFSQPVEEIIIDNSKDSENIAE